jgi:hypothetical protein
MPHCTQCGRFVDFHETVCPVCDVPLRDRRAAEEAGADGTFSRSAEAAADGFDGRTSGDRLVPIARFRSIAEAGYFAHELEFNEEISATVRTEESFDALGGAWATRFVLAVPEPWAASAAAALRELIEQTEAEATASPEQAASRWAAPTSSGGEITDLEDDRRVATATLEESGVHWVPIVLTLAAGSVAFWGARKLNEHQNLQMNPLPAAGWRHEDAWKQLSGGAQPWIQRLDNGGQRELWFDARRELATLREDTDGDGLFENELTFRRTAWQR